MGKINVLDKHIAELIAAGEVVERPSSVIKELVENSIDAGATSVTIEIKNGGVSYMRISDDGCGIEKDDIRNAFLRNATSKIRVEDDLNNIATLGFRGEALFSVCAVSRVEVMTRPKEQDIGMHYKIEGGEEALFEECGCSAGTTIIVRDLFYNTPARMKFLKKDSSEGLAIEKILDRIALSHPEVAFKFIKEGKLQLNTPGDGKVDSAIYAVYGKEFFTSLMPMDYTLSGIKVSGFISKPTSPRASKNMQHFFINGRYVKSKTAMVALEEAFKGSIMVQKFPACVMYIDLPFDSIDVNVHPSKVEIRFVDERPIFDAIYHGVKTALINNGSPAFLRGDKAPAPEVQVAKNSDKSKMINGVNSLFKMIDFSAKADKVANFKAPALDKSSLGDVNGSEDEGETDSPEVYVPKKSENVYLKKPDLKGETACNILDIKDGVSNTKNSANANVGTAEGISLSSFIDEGALDKIFPIDNAKAEQIALVPDNFDVKIVGEIFSTYIVVEKNADEVVLIDKHAAHERMIFEELKSEKDAPLSQLFLEPVVVSLSKDEYAAILDNISLFANAGFELDDFGNGAIIVRAAPSYLDNVDISDIVTQMANYILEHRKDVRSDYVEWLYENIACRAAIKAGKMAKPQEMQALVKRIIKEDPRFCPHGRPIAVTVKRREIEKRFGRV